ncbi:MAG: hypothetical protein ABJB97_08865, partial [Acidobacteriota bacterium]
DAERVVQTLQSTGIANDRVALLTPGTDESQIESTIPVSDTEQPGMGKAMGGTVGGAMGAAGGATLGAAVASLLIPGVGPVIAAGVVGAALLGAGGAATGMAAGAALERHLADGLPHDELYLYEDALRKGRSVVIAFPEDQETAETVKGVFGQAGAESIDAAREDWWLGLRTAEAEHYETQGGRFTTDEADYRRGFEAALHTKLRGRTYAEAREELVVFREETSSDDAFRRGYERGYVYQKGLQEKYKS